MLGIFGLLLVVSPSAGPVTPCAIQGGSAAEQAIWLLCDDNRMLSSSDSGKSWRMDRLPGEQTLRTVRFRDRRRGFAAGDRGALIATSDSGKTWTPVRVPTTENLTAIHFAGNSGWIVGWGGAIVHSADGGRTWEKQESGVTHSLQAVFFADERRGWAVGWAGTIVRTEDGGRKWEKVVTPHKLWSLNGVFFRDAKNGWVVGFDGQILRTRDGGLKWDLQTSPVKAPLLSVLFDNERGWVAGDTDVLTTSDGGENWKAGGLDEYFALSQVLPVGRDTVWILGQLGTLTRAAAKPAWEVMPILPVK